jgi:hypothetical protein
VPEQADNTSTEEEARAAGDAPSTISRDSAFPERYNDIMEMEMKMQVLFPAILQPRSASRLPDDGIGDDDGQGLGRVANAVDHLLVLVSNGSNLFADSEDDRKVVCLENFGRSLLDPLRTRE